MAETVCRDAEVDCALYVDEETFCIWLDRKEFRYGTSVAKWFAGVDIVEEGVQDAAVKQGDDETSVDLFRRIMLDVKLAAESEKHMVRRYPFEIGRAHV